MTTTWHQFLFDRAKFPFPITPQSRSLYSTRVSDLEIGSIHNDWRAKYAVRDDNLVGKLCTILQDILSNDIMNLRDDQRVLLEASFSSFQNTQWNENQSEAKTQGLLRDGVFNAVRKCLEFYGSYELSVESEEPSPGARSRVDHILSVNDRAILCEAKSPSVLKAVGQALPPVGFEFLWDPTDSDLMRNVLNMAAQYLGLHQLEWLFLTSHNHWIICRLVPDDQHPFLAYSQMISIEDSSEPFRALLGAILSRVKDVTVERSVFTSIRGFDPQPTADKVSDPESESGDEDESGSYRGSSGEEVPNERRTTRSSSTLMITLSRPESSQRWIRLHSLSDNKLTPPQCMGSRKRRARLSYCIGSGSTGDAWQCYFENVDPHTPYVMKIVEVLRRSDEDRRRRLHEEFYIYLLIEEAYRSRKLRRPIAPRCYGAFGNDYMEVIILDLCDKMLDSWDELSASERDDVYGLVQGLHGIGILHGDLEPRNVVHVNGDGFRLIDFSQSRKHICKESDAKAKKRNGHRVQGQKCPELDALRRQLW